jgi:hypothetical protein
VQGVLTEEKSYEFAFNKIDKQYEAYTGVGCRLRWKINNCDNYLDIS